MLRDRFTVIKVHLKDAKSLIFQESLAKERLWNNVILLISAIVVRPYMIPYLL